MNENNTTTEIIMCENCGEMFCHDINIAGPCVPIEVKITKEK